jgi:drug/metabolite transporter (DMT)-like permease
VIAYVALALQTLISAGTYLVAKAVMGVLQPTEVMWLRFVLAAAAYAVILPLLGKPLLPPAGQRGRVLALAALGLPLNQGGLLLGLSMSTPAHAAILYALTPAMVLVIARVALGEPFTARKLAGVGVAFCGVTVVLLERGLAAARGALAGDLLILIAVISWASYTVLARPLALSHGAITTTGWALLVGGAIFAPFTPFVLRPLPQLAQVSSLTWAGVAYLVLLTSVAAYVLWAIALRRLEAGKVAIFTNLQPPVTALLSWAILGERLTLPVMAGGVLVIAGVSLSQRG